MQTIGIAVWALFAVYFLLCVFLPEVRILSWRRSSLKPGTLSYLGLSLFSWTPLFAALGIIPESYAFLVYPLMGVGLVIVVIGYFVSA